MSYVPLHVHTINSPYRGMLTCEELVGQSARKGFEAVAVTDCWNMYAHHEFYRLAKDAGIKPVLGVEIQHESLTGREGFYHLTLLAETNKGYENLVSLVAQHYEKKNSKYVTAGELEQNRGGIIALTGSINGEGSQSLLHGNPGRQKQVIEKLLEIYGSDNLYLELMNHNSEREWFICENFTKLAGKLGLPLVVTNNDRFISTDEAESYFVLRSMENGEEEANSGEYYLKERKDLETYFYNIQKALDAPEEISKRCNVELKYGYRLGFYAIENPLKKLQNECSRRLKSTSFSFEQENLNTLQRNLETELESAAREELSGFLYFLTELFTKCREEVVALEVIGGSLQESFMAYLLGITLLDPLEHGLVFECFLSSGKSSLPPLELIKAYGGRESIFKIIMSLIPDCSIHFQVLREEMSFKKITRGVCEVLGVQKNIRSELDNVIAKVRKMKDLSAMFEGSPALRTLYSQSSVVRQVLHIAGILRGKICHFNLNSSRVVILPAGAGAQLSRICASPGECFLLCDKDSVDHLGGWSFVLHHSHVLSALVLMISQVKTEKGDGKDGNRLLPGALGDIPLDDSEIFNMISSGDTMGIYLLESQGVRDILKKIKPRNFNDLVTAISLYRPAPLKGGLWKIYIENGIKKELLPHPFLEEALEDTRGILLYMEQVRGIIEILAGLRGKKALEIERALRTRDSGALMGARLNFIRGAIDNGIDEKEGEKIFDFLLKNIKYTHDKALSCSQAYLSYRSAYLKTRHFESYFAALMSVYGDSPDKVAKYINYFKSTGGDILPPDINASGVNYTAEGDDIRSPISDYNDMNAETCRRIVEERKEHGEFRGISDFIQRVTDVPEISIYGMIKEGFFDNLGGDRKTMEDECVKIFERRKIQNPVGLESARGENSKKQNKYGQISLFDEENQ